jgi:HEAT repeat protein
LSWQASDAALEGLIHHWLQADQTIRLAVVQSLSRLNEQRQTEALGQQFLLWLEALPAIPANSLLRRNLVIALGQTGELAALPLLTTLLTDADEGVRLHAEAALSWLAAKQPAIAAD